MRNGCLIRLFSLFIGVSAGASVAHADRVYRFIDYPAFQNGHSLKGTVTVSDDAPLDAILDASEILSWQWRADGPSPFMTNSEVLQQNRLETLGVKITATEISLHLATPESPGPHRLQLARETPMGRGPIVHSISWSSVYTSSDGLFNTYNGGEIQSDFHLSRWSSAVSLAGTTFPIAIAVPEPAGIVLLTACAATWMLRRQ